MVSFKVDTVAALPKDDYICRVEFVIDIVQDTEVEKGGLTARAYFKGLAYSYFKSPRVQLRQLPYASRTHPQPYRIKSGM